MTTVPTPKIVALALTLFIAAIGAYFPWKYKRSPSPRSVVIMSYASMVAGGVFIAVGFLHLLGDAVDDMEDFTKAHGNYPFALLFCAFGFLFTLCIDEVGHSLSSGHSHGPGKHTNGGFAAETTPLVSKESDWAHEPEPESVSPVIEIELEGGQSIPAAIRKRGFTSEQDVIGSSGYGSADTSRISDNVDVELSSPMLGTSGDREHANKNSLATSIVLTTIFSFHSFFEGLALGIDSNTGSMVETAAGILAHKGLAGFALGVSILHGGMMPKSHYFVVMTVFCCMSPLGIVVGILVSSWTSPFWLACCFSIASGTFLFIGFMEIVMKELHPSDGRHLPFKEKLGKLIALMAGFAAMAVVSIWGD